MGGINGTLMLMKIGAKYLAGQQSASLDESVDEIEVTTKFSSDRAKEFFGGEISATGSVECIVDPDDSTNATYEETKITMRSRELVSFTIGGTEAGDDYEYGSLLITGMSKAMPQNDKVTFTLNYRVSGAVKSDTVNS